MSSTYTHADALVDLAAIEHALATDDPATIAGAATRARTLLQSAGAVGSIIVAHRAELGRLLARCESELSAHSTTSL